MRMATKGDHPQETLGAYLRAVRGQQTFEEVAEKAGLVSSAWWKLEKGKRIPSLTTLFRLHRYTGRPIEELARISGVPLEESKDRRDRAARIAAMEEAIPEMHVLVGLLPRLTPKQIDMLLTIASKMIEGETD